MAHGGYSSHIAVLPEGLESRSMIKRHVDKFRRRVWLRRACYGLLLLALAGIVALVGLHTIDQVAPSNRSVLSNLPASMIPYYWQLETSKGHSTVRSTPTRTSTTSDFHIDEVIRFDGEYLVVVRISSNAATFPRKDRLECRCAGRSHHSSKPLAVHHLGKDRAAVLCRDHDQSSSMIRIAMDGEREIQYHSVSKSHRHHDTKQPLQWNSTKLTYEAFSTDQDVVIFVHGLNLSRPTTGDDDSSERERLQQFQCVYGGHFDMPVISQAQEVVRCPHPPVDLIAHFTEKKISIKLNGDVVPSVTYYNHRQSPQKPNHHHHSSSVVGRRKLRELRLPSASKKGKRHHICSCTMVYNGAKFLKEWVHYNSRLGVEKFFLYDNNSEDDLAEVVASLRKERFNVGTVPWPWVKTQEAGFSHCSLVAEPECTWMLFTDVDEYLFPNERRFLEAQARTAAEVPAPEEVSSPSFTTPIASLIADAVAVNESGMVGQVSMFCYNFGPSGLTVTPPRGLTQGYTCRMKKAERHKSIVMLSAVHESLANVIHHFSLKPGFESKLVRPPVAVINHYKFQAWDEFKVKFHRRAATYVADWTEDRNHGSKDRVPDLGTKAVKPADWESRYCEVQDYGLKNYILKAFGNSDDGTTTNLHLPWE